MSTSDAFREARRALAGELTQWRFGRIEGVRHPKGSSDGFYYCFIRDASTSVYAPRDTRADRGITFAGLFFPDEDPPEAPYSRHMRAAFQISRDRSGRNPPAEWWLPRADALEYLQRLLVHGDKRSNREQMRDRLIWHNGSEELWVLVRIVLLREIRELVQEALAHKLPYFGSCRGDLRQFVWCVADAMGCMGLWHELLAVESELGIEIEVPKEPVIEVPSFTTDQINDLVARVTGAPAVEPEAPPPEPLWDPTDPAAYNPDYPAIWDDEGDVGEYEVKDDADDDDPDPDGIYDMSTFVELMTDISDAASPSTSAPGPHAPVYQPQY